MSPADALVVLLVACAAAAAIAYLPTVAARVRAERAARQAARDEYAARLRTLVSNDDAYQAAIRALEDAHRKIRTERGLRP